METRIVRFHNIFGPLGTWEGGREKAPAAMCRKIAMAKLTGNHEIEIWGDGEQTRSFCYIDDCLEGLHRLMRSDFRRAAESGAGSDGDDQSAGRYRREDRGHPDPKKHIDGPMGVRGRNSDNTLLRKVLNWEPAISLEEGLARTYAWIENQIGAKRAAARPAVVSV